jgi:hypothetical protein
MAGSPGVIFDRRSAEKIRAVVQAAQPSRQDSSRGLLPTLEFAARFCLVVQNGSDPDGDPTYDIYSIGDTGHTQKLNGDPVVPENYRSPDLTYTAGTSGIAQSINGEWWLLVCDEAPSCS